MTTEFTEQSFIDFKCPYCRELNSFPQDSRGLVRECLNCLESLIVPATDSETGHIIPLPITTSRLVLRRFEAADTKDLLEFMFDDEADAEHWLENDRKVKLTTPGRIFSLAVQVRASGKLIGSVGLRFTDYRYLEAEVSVEGNQNEQYQDYAQEALEGALKFCFQDLHLHRVIARGRHSDEPVCQLFAAAGLRREGEFIKHYCVDGEWLSTVWFAMLDEEFRETAG